MHGEPPCQTRAWIAVVDVDRELTVDVTLARAVDTVYDVARSSARIPDLTGNQGDISGAAIRQVHLQVNLIGAVRIADGLLLAKVREPVVRGVECPPARHRRARARTDSGSGWAGR